MAAKGQSHAEKFSRWGVAVTNLKENLDEMPHVAPDLAEMERMLNEARGLESRLEDLRGQSRELTAQLRELAKSGEKLRSRLGANLHAKFGFTSETLVKYGFRPRRIPRRRPATEKPVPEEPTPAPTDGTPQGARPK
jgi:hypothetical protein